MLTMLVVCPQERDRRAVAAAGLDHEYDVRYFGPELDEAEEFDPDAFLREAVSVRPAAVVGTKDHSALLAALLARRLGLPGPAPEAVLACQHKPTSREIQRAVVPAATPAFALVDGDVPFEPPFFVKPVVGRLSQSAVRVDDRADLGGLPEVDVDRYARIAGLAGAEPSRLRGFLAEELVEGLEVTLEGYAHRGRVTTIGLTDSVKYPGTGSFERFEYPTTLPEERQEELRGVVERLLPALGFDSGFFNVEFAVPPEGPAKIIEVNARIASQFAPLVLAVHGRSTYDALFALACGHDPEWHAGPPRGVAASYVVRVFEDAFVEAVPAPADDVEILVRPGRLLSEQGVNDARSYRLAILYDAAETRAEAAARCRARAERLTFRLAPPRET